jgi:hypothetical protein
LRYVLRDNAKLNIRYSPKERRIFAALPHDGTRINSRNLTRRVYKGDVPFNGRVIVVGTLRILQRKMAINNEKIIICSSVQAGPFPIEFWVKRARAPSPGACRRAPTGLFAQNN